MWIRDGQKYALITLGVNVSPDIPTGAITENLSLLTSNALQFPQDWRAWLGSIRVEQLETSNLFIVSVRDSRTPAILDGENDVLRDHVWKFYCGLILASHFTPAEEPALFTGACRNGEIDIRSVANLDLPAPRLFHSYPEIVRQEIVLAGQLGENLIELEQAHIAGGRWRLFHALDIYIKARSRTDILDRIHQYCRCIDGLILPEPGRTKQQFKSRTELFIGPRHHELVGQIYDIRSAVEHLHENRYLEQFDRGTRLDLVMKEAFIEYVARNALARTLSNREIWLHFVNVEALTRFWALSANDQRQIWGDQIDPMNALAEFNPGEIHNGVLGAP